MKSGSKMISPHELAALMLVQNESDQGQLDAADLESLVLVDLVTLDKSPEGQRAYVTRRGESVLKAVSRIERDGVVR
jgi:hypothetical protein